MTARAGLAVLRRRMTCTGLISLLAAVGLPLTAPAAARAAPQETISISAGMDYSACAVESGKAYCWGSNFYGQLGNGTTADSDRPTAVDTSGVLAGKTLTQVATGYFGTCALDSTGAAYCWGYNGAGGLGDGSTASSSVPVAVDASGVLAGKTLTQITVGGSYACALDSAGAAYCWGNNGNGQLGDGGTTASSVPVAVDASGVLAGKTLTQITSSQATCVLDSSGAAYCWGPNFFGEAGDGSTADTSVPVAVDTSGALAGKTLTQISSGITSTCALDSTGTPYCWGDNSNGELGDGSATDSSVPVAVDASGVLAGKTLTRISAGWGFACALDSAGAAYCWGYGGAGGLGDDSTSDSDVPVLTGPQAPAGVTALPGEGTAAVAWDAPASLDGGTLTGYTATAAPGGEACSTVAATTCSITGLTDGITYKITVVVHTTAGDSGASAPATVTPAGGVAITSRPAATAAFGVRFRFRVTAIGSPAPAITSTGRLPSGLRFSDHGDGSATISGTPAKAASGVYPLTLTARNKTGTATQAFTLTITRVPAISRIPRIRTRAGFPLRLTIRAAGYPAPVLTESGQLPPGLSFTDGSAGTAVIRGTLTPGSSGRYRITVTAISSSGIATRHFVIIVS